MAFSLHRFIYRCTLTDSDIIRLPSNLFCLIKQKSNKNTLHFWIMTPSIKAPSYLSHLSPLCLCPSFLSRLAWEPSSDRILSSILRPDSPCYAAGTELSPAAASPNLPFRKAVLLPSVSGTRMYTHGRAQTHTRTLWLNTRFWSYLVKCVYHCSTPWAYAAGGQYFAERLFEGILCLRYTISLFERHTGDKYRVCYPRRSVHFIFKLIV